jgi:glycoside/pentoside/hexuronide:cation symporter, GPH family
MSTETTTYEPTVAERLPVAAPAVAGGTAATAYSSIGVMTKLAYGIGALSDSVKTFGFTTFLLFYYTTVLGLPGALLGLAMSVGLTYDATIDPFIGHLSDRATFRFGRRHTFMLIGSICAGTSFIAVFNPPAGLSTGVLFAWLIATSFLLRTSNSVFMVPYYALGSELAADYHERTSVSAYRAGVIFAGTLLTTAAAFLVYLPSNTASAEDAKFLRHSYASLGVALGVVMIATALVATIGTLHTRVRLAGSAGADEKMPFGRTIASTLRDPSFRVLFVATCLSFMATAINAALAFHYLTYFARIDTRGVTIYMMALYGGALTGVFVWARVSKFIEKQYTFAATTIVTALVMSAGYWLVGEGRPFGTGAVPVLAAGIAVAGFFIAAGGVLAPSMLADITAQDERLHGRRRDGSFFGVYSLGMQFSGGVAVLIAGVLVDRFAGLIPGQPEQSAVTAERIALISNVIPALLLFAAGVFAFRYRLRQRDLEQ